MPTLSEMSLTPKDALIVMDVQNDFLPGGALPVPRGREIIVPLKTAIARFRSRKLPVFATRDWHPPDHCSFRTHGGPWPPHCIAGTPGAEFPGELALPPDARIVSKATRAEREAYSGFSGTGLAEDLRQAGLETLFIGGLAMDYCVLNTVLDALALGFRVYVLKDAVRAVDVRAGDGERALERMRTAGAWLIGSGEPAA
jgi:nicotinamidase/pyrazinamidase